MYMLGLHSLLLLTFFIPENDGAIDGDVRGRNMCLSLLRLERVDLQDFVFPLTI